MNHIAVGQLNSTDDIDVNFSQVAEQIRAAANLIPRPKIIFFPENTLYFRIYSKDSVEAVDLQHPVIAKIEKLTQESKLFVHFTTAVKVSGQVFNSSLLVSPEGKTEILYHKIHLFDVAIPGQTPISESSVFSRGEKSRVFKIGQMNIGSTICYDVRFAELYGIYAKLGVHAIVVPSAFLVKTGQAHWMTLLKARAIESQCFIIAAAQSGKHLSTKFPGEFRETFGHSVVFDPWGELVALKEYGAGVLSATLDFDKIENVRRSIPMASHRRL